MFRKIVLGSVLGAYGYYQWEHYNRNIELAHKLDIPFYKVHTCDQHQYLMVFIGDAL